MGLQNVITGTLALFLAGAAAAQQAADPVEIHIGKSSNLILEKQEGERRVHRSAGTSTVNASFTLKFDPANGPSKHLIMFTEDLPPGASIPVHKHPSCEEILILETGHSRVHLRGNHERGRTRHLGVDSPKYLDLSRCDRKRAGQPGRHFLRPWVRTIHESDLGAGRRNEHTYVKAGIGSNSRAAQ